MLDYVRIDHHDRQWASFLPAVFVETEKLRNEWGDVHAWLQLGWLRGPHLLVGFSTAGGLSAARRTEMSAALLRAVESGPSLSDVDEQQWLAVSIQLAKEDLIEGPYVPLVLDNQVTWVDIDDGRAYLETPVAETMGQLLAFGAQDAINKLAVPTAERNDWAFTGMAVLADEYRGGGLGRGYLSYLSHWKEFIWWHPEGDRIEAQWDATYQVQRGALARRLSTIIDADGTQDAMSARWREWVKAGMPPAEKLARSGAIGVSAPDEWAHRAAAIDVTTTARWEFQKGRGYSDFHTEFRKLDTTRFNLEHEFAGYRFLEAVQFRLLSLAGVSPLDRRTLAYLFSRAAEDYLQTTWHDLVRDGLARQAGETASTSATRRREG